MNNEDLTTQAIRMITRTGRTDSSLINRGRFVDAQMMLTVGDARWLLEITRGQVTNVTEGPFVMPSITFEIAAAEPEWHQFWQPTPPPGSQDLFALLKRRVLTLDGNLHPLMSNLFYFKFLLAAPRSQTV